MKRTLPLALLALSFAPPAAAEFEQSLEVDLSLEGRWFFENDLDPSRDRARVSASAAIEPEYLAEWNRGDHRFVFTPFARWDNEDDERSHLDIRELYYERAWRKVELRIGVSRVFWGKTEILHLVDVINQDDGVENIDGEDKLGQPLVRLSWTNRLGALQLYALPYFRERTFAGPDSRLATPFPVDVDNPRYEHADQDKHLDWAVRFQGYVGPLDYGIAHFSGTNRDPQLLATPKDSSDPTAAPSNPSLTDFSGDLENSQLPAQEAGASNNLMPSEFKLVPFYGLVDQTSLDAQLTLGGWLLKLEALYRDQSVLAPNPANPQAPPVLDQLHYVAATGGFEYTFYGVFDSSADIGLLAEYMYDERRAQAGHPFADDVFVGTRLAFNDVNDSALLAGVVMDQEDDSLTMTVEASRRLGGTAKLSLELRAFSNIPTENNPFASIADDDHVQLEYSYYF